MSPEADHTFEAMAHGHSEPQVDLVRTPFPLSVPMQSWFDVAARCYELIALSFNNEEVLTARYFSSAEDGNNDNPNLTELRRIEDCVCQLAKTRWIDMRIPDSRAQVLSKLTEALDSINLVSWGDDRENVATPYYAVIRGIDRAIQELVHLDKLSKLGPLNTSSEKAGIGVYLKSGSSRIERMLARHGITRIFEYGINDQLQRLLFYRRENNSMDLPSIIRVNTVSQASPSDETLLLRIGIAPLADCGVFSCGENEAHTQRVSSGGAAFGVRYLEDYESHFGEGVADAVSRCVQEECNVLVFPEIAMTKGLRNIVAEELRLQDAPSLYLVVAGSAWEDGNNICHLLDAYGNELGTYHKRIPFSEGAQPGRMDRALSVEGLESPGKTCTMVDVVDFGLIMPSICKDLAADDAQTRRLAHEFQPALVCCPAYTRSIDWGFAGPMHELAERCLSVSCLANLCEARPLRDEESIEFATVMAPGFRIGDEYAHKVHKAEAVKKDIQKTRECSAKCRNDGACLIVVDVRYDLNVVGEKGELSQPSITHLRYS